MSQRSILSISGPDRVDFLQGLVSNDVTKPGLIYAALLSPQGKYLADFFLLAEEARFLLDTDAALAPGLLKRLSMYKLRAQVDITQTDITPTRGTGPIPEGAFADPRHPDLGWRSYAGHSGTETDWDALHVEHVIPQSNVELIPDDSYILEAGFERLNGVDFKKGCYVGQEVTARMKHKTELRKGLAKVAVAGHAPPAGTPIEAGGKPAGTLFTSANGAGIAYLRFDRAGPDMRAGDATLSYTP